MRETKKLAISAMLAALGAVFMSLGALLEVADLTACALASLLLVFAYIELGSPYTWLIWLATSLISAIMFFSSPVWSEYLLVFGIYPLIKAYIERLPRALWWPLKLVFINAVLWIIILVVEGALGIPVIIAESDIWKTVLYLMANAAFVVYDLFLIAMTKVYVFKFRKRFERFLK